jgi:branched-chain amino acid transport system substrate-binding protein
VGVLSDCYGPFAGANELNLGAAELPLVERGAKPVGRNPSAGVTAVDVANRRVELLVGCVAGNEDVIPEARRLVEEDGVAALVGPLDPEQGMGLRAYASEQPNVAFLIQPSAAPEATLRDPLPNVFRFAPDAAQTSAGLGAYAFHTLGWRRAAIVADDVPYGWEETAGFVAEFCSLGGHVVAREWVRPGTDPAAAAARVPASADGVYVGAAVSPMQRFLQRYATINHGLAGRLVSNVALVADPSVIPSAGGIVVAGAPPFEPTPAVRSFAGAFAKAFPGIPATAPINPVSMPFATGVEAVLDALEHSHGADGRAFMHALARARIDSPLGPMRLDGHRQAVVTNYLSQVVPAGKRFMLRTIRTVPNVTQSFGGYFDSGSTPASATSPPCIARTPPVWAR